MELRRICLRELTAFVESTWFQRLPIHPISLLRVESYLANPHALPEDPVLYYYSQDDEIISFRTVLPGFLNMNDERFAWLSGAWTHPLYRKKNLSTKLLKEVVTDWSNRLMATNFSPASRNLYSHSNLLHACYEAKGARFYLQPDVQRLLQLRLGKLAFVSVILNVPIRAIAARKMRQFQVEVPQDIRWEKMAFPDAECMALANDQQSQFFFKRGEAELKWILAYPWVSTDDRTFEDSYPFSSYSRQFEIYTVKLFQDTRFLGFLIYSLRDGHLKLLHQHFNDDCSELVAKFFIAESVNQQVSLLTILNPEVAEQVKKLPSPFLFSKEFRHSIYTSMNNMPDVNQIQPGEGDFIFT